MNDHRMICGPAFERVDLRDRRCDSRHRRRGRRPSRSETRRRRRRGASRPLARSARGVTLHAGESARKSPRDPNAAGRSRRSRSGAHQQALRLPGTFSDVLASISAGSSGPGRLLVPGLRLQPVAHDLLVERRRAHADAILVRRPEARRVRRQHFVDQEELARRVGAELELGIGNDDALGGRIGRGLVVEAAATRRALARASRRR